MQTARKLQEEILLFKIRHGDEAAFAKIYDRYVDALFRFVSFRVPTTEQAQDIVSELFLKLWQNVSQSDVRINNLQAFVYQMARNLIADFYRATQESLPLEAVDAISTPASRAVSASQTDLTEIEFALRQLKPEWQEVVVLAYVEGFKPREIALIIGKSPAATRVMLHRALQELRRIMSQELRIKN